MIIKYSLFKGVIVWSRLIFSLLMYRVYFLRFLGFVALIIQLPIGNDPLSDVIGGQGRSTVNRAEYSSSFRSLFTTHKTTSIVPSYKGLAGMFTLMFLFYDHSCVNTNFSFDLILGGGGGLRVHPTLGIKSGSFLNVGGNLVHVIQKVQLPSN